VLTVMLIPGQTTQTPRERPMLILPLSRGEVDRRAATVKEVTIQATAYSHTGNRTFTETWPREGRTIAVDPKAIPLGSRVFIKELNNWYLAEDLIPDESVAKGAKIDIFMSDEKSCWAWGRRDVRVVVESVDKVEKQNK